MKFDQSALSLIIVTVLFAAIFAGILLIWRKVRRGGVSSATLLVATYEFYNADQRQAVETIVERASGQQEEAQPSGETPDPGCPE
jgi:hypothetical protein